MATSGTIEGNWVDYGGNHFWAKGEWKITTPDTTHVKMSMDVYVIIGPWHYEDLSNFKMQVAFTDSESWWPSGGKASTASGYINNQSSSSSTSPYYIGNVSWTYEKTSSALVLRPWLRVWDDYLGTGYSTASSSSSVYTIPAITTSYTVTYNANGGSGAPASQTKQKDVTLKLSTTTPTRTGYTFKGWGTSSTTTTVSYAAGANYTKNANITLYAIWTPVKYTVTYNANGGSGAPASQQKTHGVTLTLSSTKPTRSNYTFAGWGTSSTATTVSYAAGAKYTTNKTITLYALWNRTITYNKNNSSATGTMANTTAILNKTFTLRANAFKLLHYNFAGWATSSSGSVAYADKGTYPKTGANQTLYAKWEPKTTNTIRYAAGSNQTGVTNLPADQTKYQGETLTLSETIPERPAAADDTEYEFSKWTTAADGSGSSYAAGGSYTLDASPNSVITLYAQWITDPSNVIYTYTFKTDANTIYNTNSKMHTNDSYTIPSNTPTKDHYIFGGWTLETLVDYTDEEEDTEGYEIYQPNDPCNIQQDSTFYALWIPESYTITFNSNAPLDNNGNSQIVRNMPQTQYKQYTREYEISPVIPLTDNYVFKYWASENLSIEEIQNLEEDSSIIVLNPEDENQNKISDDTYFQQHNNNLTLYAIWELEEKSHVRINIGENIPSYGWIDLYSQGEWDAGVNYQDAGANSAHILWFAHSKLQALKFKVDNEI